MTKTFLTSFVATAVLFISCPPASRAESLQVQSPDGRWVATLETAPHLVVRLTSGGRALLQQEIGMTLANGKVLGGGQVPTHATRRTIDETVTPVAPVKSAQIRDHANELVADFADGYSVVLRAYDEGVAYRFVTRLPGDITVRSETQKNTFDGDPQVFFGREKDFYSHNEVLYDVQALSKLEPKALASLPLLVRSANGGPALLFSETALEDYPGEWIRVGADGKSLDGTWPALPKREEETSDRDIVIRERDVNIARVKGTREFPWRFVGVAATDGDLLTNQLSYLLAGPSRIADPSWIKPGKVQWDWWHDFNVYDVDFHGGVSQALYLHYIDFASTHAARYVILDEGWYKLGDLTQPDHDIDVPALVAHGRDMGVGVILWASWSTLKKQFDVAMPQFERWGIAGLKVDFFQRDDQPVIDFYWKLAADAANRKLLLDFHGAHKPAGLNRTFPNVLTSEGVKGLENCKWSADITPEHDTTLPFIRQVAGPMDYTPGAMDNAQKDQFRSIFRRPMSQGTRCHQLALYVVFESPLQMYADSPTHYRQEPECFLFMQQVPTVWDETRVLGGEVRKYVALARRAGDTWFLGALNNSEPRALDLDLSFLPKEAVNLVVWQDGPNADRDGRDYRVVELPLDASRHAHINLAPGGGWVAVAKAP